MEKIAVTGIGVVSALGIGQKKFRENCRRAFSGISKIELFDTKGFRSNVAGWVADFNPKQFMPPSVYRRMSRISAMAVVASIEAIADSGLALDKMDRDRCAVVMGTADGPSSQVNSFFSSLLENGPRGSQPLFFPETVPNAPASHIGMFHGITGPNTTFCQNMISAEQAICYGRDMILMGQADMAVVGGADELSAAQFACYDAIGALSRVRVNGRRPDPLSFGGGMVLGEGAGVLVLERLDAALSRGAKIYGLLLAAVVTGGRADMGHYEASGEQLARAMTTALSEAGLSPEDISQLNVSANYTQELGRMESEQIEALFAPSHGAPQVFALKYLMGDFGGAGAIRAAASLISLYRQASLPLISAAALLADNGYRPAWSVPEAQEIHAALMTSATFGGAGSCLIFSRQKRDLLS
ncbi:MAG: beta-ketoacyl synthase N-terminal-like domain-containing protein [Desulfobacterales bacterium]|jgi:3-oxoacyl-[acyl-carrier-protein] synthase II|nr:beta-ketoacyl synthase N-terminal-like domain-containing protein [Desulfobacterales bacterium]